MEKIYRVTPLRGKWIVQRVSDRKTMHKPFRLKTEANDEVLRLTGMAAFEQNKGAAVGIKFIDAFKKFAGQS